MTAADPAGAGGRAGRSRRALEAGDLGRRPQGRTSASARALALQLARRSTRFMEGPRPRFQSRLEPLHDVVETLGPAWEQESRSVSSGRARPGARRSRTRRSTNGSSPTRRPRAAPSRRPQERPGRQYERPVDRDSPTAPARCAGHRSPAPGRPRLHHERETHSAASTPAHAPEMQNDWRSHDSHAPGS